MPRTVTLLVPLPQTGRSTVTATSLEVIGRRSATPEMDGNVVMSTTRNRSRVISAPVSLVNVCRMSTVPNAEFCAGTHGDTMSFGGPQYAPPART